MSKKILVYSKHAPTDHCGVAYFTEQLARRLGGNQIHGFHGFGRCDEFYINLDILELNREDVDNLITFIGSKAAKKTILIMHDYRFSYLEDRLLEACDQVLNLSGEPALGKLYSEKTMQLFTPSLIDKPVLALERKAPRPLSLAFGFFSAKKKSFRTYVAFYEYMLDKHPDWFHIVVASAHTGTENPDNMLSRLLPSDKVLVMDFLPNAMLSELIHAADLGVCFYPDGIRLNNTAPMSFFQQGKTVLTTFGDFEVPEYQKFALDHKDLDRIDFKDLEAFRKRGHLARTHYESNLNWDVFIKRMYGR